jgi:hypothetical protein
MDGRIKRPARCESFTSSEISRLPGRPVRRRPPTDRSLDERGVVLRTSEGREITVAAWDVEELRPSRASLMPDRQLADLTAQEAADLIEYLASLK